MKHLVVGLGEIGKAIQAILGCDGVDKEWTKGDYGALHICFPFSEHFMMNVRVLKIRHNCEFVIIHSTVPVGTAEKLNAISSPCRGVHPYLEQGIRTFVKYFGGTGSQHGADLFTKHGIICQVSGDSRSVEAMKLWDTAQYGLNILLEKEIYRYCEENNLNFDTVYSSANVTYNAGFRHLGMSQFKKYVLKHIEGKIGGHCIIPNCKLLDSWVSTLILEKNENIIPRQD